jgi:primosomal protein N' (replication factor Y)
MCKQYNIPIVLGSATPNIETFYKAKSGKINIFELKKRANESSLPNVQIIDLRKEIESGNKSIISTKLQEMIEKNLNEKKQTILFLNRRGFSTYVICADCGFTAKCPNCSIALTHHANDNKLKCHYCGYERDMIHVCPVCGGKKVRYYGMGTQKIEAQIKEMFPKANTIRMDIDTVSKKNSHEQILDKFVKDNIDILIGTQMVVKGHHFPNVTLVGVISADNSLNVDDYRASERTFQILTQVAGRAGREGTSGEVIIQTYNPDNFSIECGAKQDYNLFYNSEVIIRENLKYPPFCDIVTFNLSGEDETEVEKQAKYMYNILVKNSDKTILIFKPQESSISKINNKYRWRIVAKAKLNSHLIDIINKSLKQLNNKKKVSIVVDVNPNNMI